MHGLHRRRRRRRHDSWPAASSWAVVDYNLVFVYLPTKHALPPGDLASTAIVEIMSNSLVVLRRNRCKDNGRSTTITCSEGL